MRKKVPAFFVIELVMYTGLAVFLVWLAVGFTAHRYIIMRNEQKYSCRFIQVHTGLASLRRIIEKFQMPIEYWKKRSSQELIVANAQEDTGLKIEQGKLWYITGSYSRKNNEWLKKNRSLVIDYVQDGSFELITSNKAPVVIKGVCLKASFKTSPAKLYTVDIWHALKHKEIA